MATSARIARALQEEAERLPFWDFFGPDVVLVPTPKSSLSRMDTLWVPLRLAEAMVSLGLGSQVHQLLKRVRPVAKSAGSDPAFRPRPQTHYDSFAVQKVMRDPHVITLVDDIVTRGATLLAAASKLRDAYPHAHLHAFAAMRTVSNADTLTRVKDPQVEWIRLRPEGDTLRRP